MQFGGYISYFIGYEGFGSIMFYVKFKGWVNGLGVGLSNICFGFLDLFDIGIILIEEGLKNYKEIVKVVFEYIVFL